MKEHVLSNKFADKWSGPYTVVRLGKNGTYYLEGARSTKIKAAVNGDSLKRFIESKRMVPDVGLTRANEYFKTWVLTRNQQ